MALSVPAFPHSIEVVGVLGNSGVAGEFLVKVEGIPPAGRVSTGVALDVDLALWTSGGDTVNRLSLDGRLLRRFPLEPKGSIVESRTFAVLEGTLYFLGRTPDGRVRLFSLPMREGGVARPLDVPLPERKRPYVPYCLSPQPLRGRLVLACEPKELDGERIGVYFLRPKPRPALRLAFSVPGSYPQGIAVDARKGVIYLGGHFGHFIAGETHPMVYAVAALNERGRMLEGFPVFCPKTPAIPTQFRGVISLAGGALWDTAWYGFLARLDLRGNGAPGRVVQWHHELGYPTQVLAVGGNPSLTLLAITTSGPEALYLARWDEDAQRLEFVRRIGCLPVISSLGLSRDGWATVGTGRAQLWWRWGDGPDSPPRKAELHIAVTPGLFHEGRYFALAAQYQLDDLERRPPVPAVFSPLPGGRNEARRLGGPVPARRPVGLSVQLVPGRNFGWLFVTDAVTQGIWRTRLWLPRLEPDGRGWRPVQLEGVKLRSPTDIAALTDGRLIVADKGRLLVLTPDGEAYRLAKVWRWEGEPAKQLGGRLRFAISGPWMLLSDTERHRVLWLDWRRWEVLAVLGQTDVPGDDLKHLNRPTLVALEGTRGLVADSGNQRVLEVRLLP